MATPRVAAGALFFDDQGNVLIVKPSYKDGWEIPGGYVEPGESPRAACIREVKEEIGLTVSPGAHLVVDWAPAATEGDKLLFVFDGGALSDGDLKNIRFADGELTHWRFVAATDLDELMPARLVRRIRAAVHAKATGIPAYIENGAWPVQQSSAAI
jgi:8-oxo-dGTP diphosphatase